MNNSHYLFSVAVSLKESYTEVPFKVYVGVKRHFASAGGDDFAFIYFSLI